VAQNSNLLPIVIEAGKQKGIRFDVARFRAPEAVHLNENVMVIRGSLCKLIDRLFEGFPSIVTGKQIV
jgi:hypothetical protein